MCVCVCVFVHPHMPRITHTHTHTHAHTHTRTHRHTHTNSGTVSLLVTAGTIIAAIINQTACFVCVCVCVCVCVWICAYLPLITHVFVRLQYVRALMCVCFHQKVCVFQGQVFVFYTPQAALPFNSASLHARLAPSL